MSSDLIYFISLDIVDQIIMFFHFIYSLLIDIFD